MAIVTTRPGIKVKVGVKFPAQVNVVTPLTLTKTGATYTFAIDTTGFLTGGTCWIWQLKFALQNYGQLYTIDAAIPADPTSQINVIWNVGARSQQGDLLSTFIKSTLGWSDAQMTALYSLAASMIS